MTKEALVHLFRTLKDNIRLVLLNACSTRPQAEAIAETIDCTIGMRKPIGDEAAIVFAASFYRTLGFGRSVKEAFEVGKAWRFLLESIPEDKTPELLTRAGVDASAMMLVQPSAAVAARTRFEQIGQPSDAQALALVRDLGRLAPADWSTLVSGIEGRSGPHQPPRHRTGAGCRADPLGGEPHRTRARGDRGGLQDTEPLTGPPPPDGTTTVGQAFWNVPHPRNPSFTGREAEIAGLRERLARKRKTALAQAISGLGGIGKTQTAVEYAYRYRDEYKAVLWLNAESPLSLKTGCGDIARQMPLPHDEKDLDQAAAAVKYWLGTHPDWLLILDNADDPAVLEPFLPTDHEGHILITSRAQDFQHLGILDPVELGELPIEDATAFLLRRCGREGATRQSEARHANWPASWTDCRSRWSRQRLTSWQPERHSRAISRVTARAAWLGSKRAGRPLGDTPSRSPPPGPPISRRCRRTPKPLPTSCGSVPSWLQTRSLSSY